MNVQDLWADTMADKAWNKKQGKLIAGKIGKLFKNIPRTKYWVCINYFKPDNSYYIFFNVKKKGTYQRSIPVVSYPDLEFDRLISILKEVRRTYQFTFKYVNFDKEQIHKLLREVK